MASVSPETFGRDLIHFGVPPELARRTVELMDERMKETILRLYRSAVNLGAEWEPCVGNVTAPSLVFWGQDDTPNPHRVRGPTRRSHPGH